jgi:hypothetical protein
MYNISFRTPSGPICYPEIMTATTAPRSVTPDEALVIRHRKAKNVVMMIPSKGVFIERPSPKDPVTREPRPNTVEQKQHRILLDADGNGEVCGAVWADIVRSGYAHHFLILPNNNRPKTQGLDMRPHASAREVDVTTPEDEGRVRDRLRTSLRLYSTQVRMPVNG